MLRFYSILFFILLNFHRKGTSFFCRYADNQGIHIFADLFHPKYSIVVGGAGISLEQLLSLSPDNLF